MKTHPVIPPAKLFEDEIKKDITEYEALLAEMKQMERKTGSNQYQELLSAYNNCDSEVIDALECPRWKPWGEWSNCSKCGARKRFRSGCEVGKSKK